MGNAIIYNKYHQIDNNITVKCITATDWVPFAGLTLPHFMPFASKDMYVQRHMCSNLYLCLIMYIC